MPGPSQRENIIRNIYPQTKKEFMPGNYRQESLPLSHEEIIVSIYFVPFSFIGILHDW